MIQLVEIEGKVTERGCIEIPAVALEQTGIAIGEAVKMVYMAGEESAENEAREFLLIKSKQDAREELTKEQQVSFQIPQELLVDAGIPLDADLDIICKNQSIIILPADPVPETVLPKELVDVCQKFGVSKDRIKVMVQTWEEGDRS